MLAAEMYQELKRDGRHVMLRQADDPKHIIPHWTVADKLTNTQETVLDQ